MAKYYVNKNAQSNGDHEVHTESCSHLPEAVNRLELGTFSDCKGAVAAAKKLYTKANGCYWCSSACHTS